MAGVVTLNDFYDYIERKVNEKIGVSLGRA